MSSEQMNPSQFADEIKLQRSSLSHVLSGRNKPSLDFVMKIKQRFAKVNLDWLIFGDGIMFSDMQNTNNKHESPDRIEDTRQSISLDSESQDKFSVGSNKDETHTKQVKNFDITTSAGKAEKVIIFFNDGTFEEYSNK